MVVAVRVERLPFDVFEREIRRAVIGEAGVIEASDVGVLEAGQDTLLMEETLPERRIGEAAAHELERHLPVEVGALGEVDDAHAAASYLAQETVWPYRSSFDISPCFHSRSSKCSRALAEETGRIGLGMQQRLDLATQIGIVGAGFIEESSAVGRVAFECGIQQAFDLRPTISIHSSLPLVLSTLHSRSA